MFPPPLLLLTLAAEPRLERTHAEFSFHLDVEYPKAAPMFGAWAEKTWDSDWKPEFLYPAPAADEEGSIFTVPHDGTRALWITTVFDLERGHVQYLYLIERKLVTRIDIHLTKPPSGTDVHVLYERTALDPAANAHIKALSETDARRGPDWKRAIEAASARDRQSPK